MENQIKEKTKFYRFQIFTAENASSLPIRKSKSVGMAFLREGQAIYTIRLWTLSWERFYLIPNREDSTKFLIQTREPNRNPGAKNKFFWNIVGNGSIVQGSMAVRLDFDLFSMPIFMSIHPEANNASSGSHFVDETEVA